MKAWKWQLNQEKLTFIMLMLAFITLFYGMHRANINQRNQIALEAGFRLLEASNMLQTLVHKAHYDTPEPYTHYTGWEKILFIGDLSLFMNKKVNEEAKLLETSWKESSQDLNNKKKVASFLKHLTSFRMVVRQSIQTL
jgi:hypothetical protein